MRFNKSQIYRLKKALLQLSEIATEEGVTLVTDSELEVGAEVFVNGDDGLIPASDGTYNYNGTVINVEGGVVTSITETPVETEETPVEAETETQEETAEDETPAETESTEETAEEVAEVAEEVAQEATEEVVDVEALNARIAELEALVAELTAKLQEPVADSVEEEMKNDEKPQNNKKPEMNYMAAIRKAKEIKIVRK